MCHLTDLKLNCHYNILPFDRFQIEGIFEIEGTRTFEFTFELECTRTLKLNLKLKVQGHRPFWRQPRPSSTLQGGRRPRGTVHQMLSLHSHFFILYQFIQFYFKKITIATYILLRNCQHHWCVSFPGQWLHQRLLHPGPTHRLPKEIYCCSGEKKTPSRNIWQLGSNSHCEKFITIWLLKLRNM